MLIPAGYGSISIGLTETVDTDEMDLTWGVSLAGAPDPSDLANFCISFAGGVADHVSSIVKMTFGRCRLSDADGGGTVEVDLGGIDFGTSGGDVLPNNAALIIKKGTGLGGRRHRGRVFVPGVLNSDIDDGGSVSSTARGDINGTLASSFLAGFPYGDILLPVLLHATAPATPDPITTVTVSPRLGTMRNRYRN